MDEITDLLSEKRLAKYKGIGKEKCHCLVICLIVNWRNLFILRCHIFEIILRNKIDKAIF
ncbi:MAG: hypothetical protein ACLU99_11230 [Alphaproteobacteria bacterium]